MLYIQVWVLPLSYIKTPFSHFLFFYFLILPFQNNNKYIKYMITMLQDTDSERLSNKGGLTGVHLDLHGKGK